MTEKYPFFMITFPSVHHALRFESRMKGSGTSFQLVPVPREISSSCGVAAKVTATSERALIDTVEKVGVEYDSIYLYQSPKEKPRLLKRVE
ncbi:DUF3343 domain-containing protein [Thermosediminibacter oceani]|uniref:Putative Se/S carrier protein-like domain-containing protein n=1 Tax=Thermosediminibacter oceani (strain ATCC BAA-1034 / DSM 16646 / JW/IW-1228P) TaxID=555079 RepID=D9RZS5_THEOJ|nr:DUF3343 domain-containing protein [Thermosediminibacter oceani]ADL08702.1 hypothetical protein Toce_1981 [Thermosediminibacter oceani DSM 16646]